MTCANWPIPCCSIFTTASAICRDRRRRESCSWTGRCNIWIAFRTSRPVTPGLQRELASAYERVGDVQGNPYYANLGDTAGATESYRKALQIRLALAGDQRGSAEDRAALAAVYVKQGFAFRAGNNFPAAFEALRRAYPITQKLAADQKDDPKAQDTFAGVCFAMAQCLGDMGDVAGALEYYRKSATIREAITGGSPAFRVERSNQTCRRVWIHGRRRALEGRSGCSDYTSREGA